MNPSAAPSQKSPNAKLPDRTRLLAACARVTEALLAAQNADGYWAGELSSSALSTATAVCAFATAQRASGTTTFSKPISAGLDWLARHRNPDGGWGDTILSLSNISTTVLVWAAFGSVPGADETYREAVAGAEHWLSQQAGSLEKTALASAIIQRYGKDRTFSVPILTMCALVGRLGPGPEAWRHVIPLPFELAACPHQWFAALRLPVVSYALPALIAIGQARHFHCPPRNPLTRLLRNLTLPRTLKVLESIQPASGGFLEATPLTSFVTMSLAGSAQAEHPVTKKGLQFLLASQHSDGSWPIDTNLATWLTTLSVNALAGAANGSSAIPHADQAAGWLLAQQYRHEHPYTHAAPGGWAWTDLSGGVPDADDTAGALLALRHLPSTKSEISEAASQGVNWLLGLQNRDGGIPTFCRGWGALPFDRSSADLTAHAIRAWSAWQGELPPLLRDKVKRVIPRALAFLCRIQRPDGSWVPLWFGNQFAPAEENATYGTSRVLLALPAFASYPDVGPALNRALNWLLEAQNADGSWGGFAKGPASIEETALALEALAAVLAHKPLASVPQPERLRESIARATSWLLENIESDRWKNPAPIGFYFAKLWYYEKLYPLIFTVSALNKVASLQPA